MRRVVVVALALLVLAFATWRVVRSQVMPADDPAIYGDSTAWENEPLTRLAADGQLMAFEHRGFWLAPACGDAAHVEGVGESYAIVA